ncbi:MAG TPA: hypothetical protein VE780_14555 [Thermoleophilaceae bacterium]|nr:hypothetical protein [Thermoleophilaceae bacterium]
MWFEVHTLALNAVQAGCLALPGAGVPRDLSRFRTRAWALVPPLSIAVVVGVIAVVPISAQVLTWTALILVPIGCAIALAWAMRGARPWLATLCAPLLAFAWMFQTDALGQLAATALIAGSVIALGRLLAGGAPLPLLKAGVIAMAAVDAYLVFSNKLQAPNAVLIAAKPAAGVPRLQSATFGGSYLGYGDLFAAAVVGGILAVERLPQIGAAVALLVVAFCWNQLFVVYDVLPATIPPAVVLIGSELVRRRGRTRSRHRDRAGPAETDRLPPAAGPAPSV